MREIKFRAWEKSLKEMIPVDDITFHLENNVINSKGAWRLLDEIELMQYTGLKDKNGVEIYEGDICLVTHHEDIGEDSYYNEFHMQVRWESEQASWLLDGEHDNYQLGRILYLGERDWSYSVEVIGNIYENPELLK